MYERKPTGWLKHLDFILIDMLCQQLAFILSHAACCGKWNPYTDGRYGNLAVVFLLIDFLVALVFSTFSNVLKRGYYKEFIAVLKHVFLMEGLGFVYLFTIQEGVDFSRDMFYWMAPLYIAFTYAGRILWKLRQKKRKSGFRSKSLIILAPAHRIGECIKNICETNFNTYAFVGAVVTDEDRQGEAISGIPVVANYADVLEYIRREWVDEVFLAVNLEEGYPAELVEKLKEMGVAAHITITRAGSIMENTQIIERLGNYTVLTVNVNCASSVQLGLKRLMDLVGGLLGCVVSAVLCLFVAPAIYISSPGPVFFTQERVGRNGKKFRMYKFRTMYSGAEQHKEELMARNRMQGGQMFKVESDPRIIGNKTLPDGTIKKGIGSFLRETSLDEFPQMLNVLRGDMSLVGTRPPTVDEWEKYELHHRARLAFKPGLTGLWQISGRSSITDFEEVVKLDTRYIDEWSLGLDIKIIFKTIGSAFRRRGAM